MFSSLCSYSVFLFFRPGNVLPGSPTNASLTITKSLLSSRDRTLCSRATNTASHTSSSEGHYSTSLICTCLNARNTTSPQEATIITEVRVAGENGRRLALPSGFTLTTTEGRQFQIHRLKTQTFYTFVTNTKTYIT